MSRFLDGPAKGTSLMLRRAPFLLRVVQSAAGEWDALDQLNDEPTANEAIHIYQMVGRATQAFVDGRDKAGRRIGGCYAMADYRHFTEEIGPEHTRTNGAWRAWCEANKDRLLKGTGAA